MQPMYSSQQSFSNPTKNRKNDPSMFQLLASPNHSSIGPSDFKKNHRFVDPQSPHTNMLSHAPWNHEEIHANFPSKSIPINQEVLLQVENYIQCQNSKKNLQKSRKSSEKVLRQTKNGCFEQKVHSKNSQSSSYAQHLKSEQKYQRNNKYLSACSQKQNSNNNSKDLRRKPCSAKNILKKKSSELKICAQQFQNEQVNGYHQFISGKVSKSDENTKKQSRKSQEKQNQTCYGKGNMQQGDELYAKTLYASTKSYCPNNEDLDYHAQTYACGDFTKGISTGKLKKKNAAMSKKTKQAQKAYGSMNSEAIQAFERCQQKNIENISKQKCKSSSTLKVKQSQQQKSYSSSKQKEKAKAKSNKPKSLSASNVRTVQKLKLDAYSQLIPKQKSSHLKKQNSKKLQIKRAKAEPKKNLIFQSSEDEPQQEISSIEVSEILKKVGTEYKKDPENVLQILQIYHNKNKGLVGLRDFASVLKQLQVNFNQDQAIRIFEQNMNSQGFMNYQTWLNQIITKSKEGVDEKKENKRNQIAKKEKGDKSQLNADKIYMANQFRCFIENLKAKDSKQEAQQKIDQNKREKEPANTNKKQGGTQIVSLGLPNQVGLNFGRSILSARMNNPRHEIFAQRLKSCIKCPKQVEKLQKEYLPKAAQLKKSKKRFEDKEFPPNLTSITKNPNSSKINRVKNISWKHYSDFIRQPKLFHGGIEPNDILQGALGNCYFLSALACLAEYSNLIERIFEYADVETGYFLIWLCIDGAWKLYEIDGNIVVNPQGNQPHFTRSRQGELWVVLLEKAYAKAYGCFEHIIGGDTSQAIRDLTGSPSKLFDHSQIQQQTLWKQLFTANENKFIMSAGTDNSKEPQQKIEGRQEGTTAEGLVLGHAYSILDVRQINREKIIQLRNPWGSMQWNGDWSDKSSKWTKELRQKLDYYSGQDGIFWMPFKDYFKKYRFTGVNYLKPQYIYQSQTKKNATSLVIKVSHNELKQLFIGLSQIDKRHKGKSSAQKYESVKLLSLIGKCGRDINVLRKVDDINWVNSKEVKADFLDVKQNEEVVLIVKLPKQTDLTVSIYANCTANFKVEALSDEEEMKYSEGIAFLMKNNRNSSNGFELWTIWVGEILFYCIKNVSSSKNTIKLIFKQPINIDFISPSNVQREYTLNLQKGQMKSIKAQLKDENKQGQFGPVLMGFI